MERQMQMVFMDDGMDKDPVSGNDVPTGSLAEEVRDDVPAMLSEGEYVVPADVLRFYGMKFFEDLRTNAKMELGRMEAEGRIGGEPVAEGEPMKAAGGALAIDGLSGGTLLRLYRAIKEVHPNLSWDETIYIGKQLYQQGNKDRNIIDFDVESMKDGGVIKANTGVTVGGGNMTAEQQAAQAASNASASVTTSAGNTGYTAPIKPPSNEAFMKAVNVGGSSAPKTAKYISSSGALIDVLVGPDGLPLYGAPEGYIKASSPEGQQLMVQFGHSQADPNVADTPDTDLEQAIPKPKKDDKSGQDAFDRAEKTRKEIEDAQAKAIKRLGIEDRADDYKALSLAQRASLALIEGKKMLDPDYVITSDERDKINEVLDNPAEAPELLDLIKNPLALLTGGSKQPDTESDTVSKDRPKPKVSQTEAQNIGSKSKKDRKEILGDIDKVLTDAGVKSFDKDDDESTLGTDTKAGGASVDQAFGISGLNKGALVTKPKRKPKAKRKSLGQK